MFGIGGSEIIFILFVILLLFGADKIPEIARGLGKGIKMVKNATNEIKTEITRSAEESFETDLGKDVKEEFKSVKKEIEDISGAIKRENPFRKL